MMNNLLNTKRKCYTFLLGVMCCACFLCSCKDNDTTDTPPVSESSKTLDNINSNVKALHKLIEAKQGDLTVKTYNPVNNGASYTIELSDGTSFSIYAQISALESGGETLVYSPKVGVGLENGEFYWIVDNEWLTFDNNESSTASPVVGINTDGYWTVKYGTKSRTLDKEESGRPTS